MLIKKYASKFRRICAYLALELFGWRDKKSKALEDPANLPPGFDASAYLALNPDLGEAGILTREQAERHYLRAGRHEGRLFKFPEKRPGDLPDDFEWQKYLFLNPDLKQAGVKTEEQAVAHWLACGMQEDRRYKIDDFAHLGHFIHRKVLKKELEPLKLSLSSAQPRRINILLENPCDVFGGYIATYYLAWKLHEWGFRVRLVIFSPYLEIQKRYQEVESWEGLGGFTQKIELEDHASREKALQVNPEDRFIARSCWGAYVAARAAEELGGAPFIFFNQEYEPVFFSHSWRYAYARNAYKLRQRTLFSTGFLKDYVAGQGLGTAAGGADAQWAVLENPVPRFDVRKEILKKDSPKKLIFYVRPQAERNLFELGFLALTEAVRSGVFDRERWEFYGIGTSETRRELPLANGAVLKIIPRMPLKDYMRSLPHYSAGLSLMFSPHPGLVPLEMAAAGLPAVTTVYANKSAEALKRISSNIIPVEAALEAIVEGIKEAVAASRDIEGRLAGTQLIWPRSWDEAFNPALKNQILEWLE